MSINEDWKQELIRLRLEKEESWESLIDKYQGLFPEKSRIQMRKKLNLIVMRAARSKKRAEEKSTKQAGKEFKPESKWKDGVYERLRLVEMNDEDDKSPTRMMELHGFDPNEWILIDCVNNEWNAQVHHSRVDADGRKLEMRQSKIRVKPKVKTITLEDIKKWFDETTFTVNAPLTVPLQYDPNGETLELDFADLHNGLYAWIAETGANYDIKIARKFFMRAIADILSRCHGRKFKQIILALLGDLLHTDNESQTTTKGTFQQVDGRIPLVFTETLEMLIEAVTQLAAIAPVDVLYTRGNHDYVTGWTLIKALEQRFYSDTNITVDVCPDTQKHRLIGNTLIGFVHGAMPEKNLSGWLQVLGRKLDKSIPFMEVHSGHRHEERLTEIKQTKMNEGVVVRTMPTISNSSTWEHDEGYAGATRAVMCFVWDDVRGLREIWYCNM